MPLPTIPLLDEEYPLYDWSGYQSSRDALVQGTPTKRFAKEAWNAIVDSLSEALEAAGLSWNESYTTAEGAKITEPYGKLTADKFNSVRHNIDWPAPLGWAWADREDFRGYVGREDFQGYQEHHKEADKVYPEYILELVRKLNFLLEIMRYTAPLLEAETSTIIPAPHKADGVAGIGAVIKLERLSSVENKAEAITGKVLETEASVKMPSSVIPGVITGFGGDISVRLTIPLTVDLAGRTFPSARGEAQSLIRAPITVSGFGNPTVDSETYRISHSKAQASAVSNEAIQTSAAAASFFTPYAEGRDSFALSGDVQQEAHTSQFADLSQNKGSTGEARSRIAAKVLADPTSNLAAHGLSVERIKTPAFCALDTAWYPPVWVDGGLWIRQSHSVTQNENGELVIL